MAGETGHARRARWLWRLWKLRSFVIPVLVVAGASAGASALLAWWAARHPDALLAPDVVLWFAPTIAGSVAVWLWLRRRVGFLSVKRLRRQPEEILPCLASVVVLLASLAVYQGVEGAAGELTRVTDAAEIASHPATRYYAVGEPCLDRAHALFDGSVSHRRGGNSLDLRLVAVAPFCAARGGAPPAWVLFAYNGRAELDIGEQERRDAWERFRGRSIEDFRSKDPRTITYLERVTSSFELAELRRVFEPRPLPPGVILKARFDALDTQRDGALGDVWGLLAVSAILLAMFVAVVAAAEVDRKYARRQMRVRRGVARPLATETEPGVREWLVENWGLVLLVAANVLVFVAMKWSLGLGRTTPEQLVAWGANHGPLLRGAGLLRLVTSTFVHADVMHLLNNVYGLIFAGLFLNPFVGGRLRVVALYLLTGVAGTALSAAVHPEGVSVGASGAVFGMFGTVIGLALRGETGWFSRKWQLLSVAAFVGPNLVLGALLPEIDNAAHLGGLLCGLGLGYAFAVVLARRRRGLNWRASPPARP